MTSAQSLDPPKSPLKRGTLINFWFPPWNASFGLPHGTKSEASFGFPHGIKSEASFGFPHGTKSEASFGFPHGTKSETSFGLPLLKGDGRGI